MKLYETMRQDENMSWCVPYVNEDGKAIVVNETDIIRSNGIKELNMEKSEIIDKYNLVEVGCCDCPYKDECEAMD